MYKFVVWENKDLGNIKKYIGNDILTIGSEDKNLKWSELKLLPEQLIKVDRNTQFIFNSHGTKDEKACNYMLEDETGENRYFDSLKVISEILNNLDQNNGSSLHMISCHVGMVHDELVKAAISNIGKGEWYNNTIFLHGGNDSIRGYRVSKVFEIIDNQQIAINSEDLIKNRLDLFQKFYTDTPGDLSLIQLLKSNICKPLVLKSNFVGSDLQNIEQNISNDWNTCRIEINEFCKQNNLDYVSNDQVKINIFEYLKNSLAGGATEFYQLEFPTCIGLLNGKSAKVDDENVTKFVEDLYQLVENQTLSKSQFDELIAIQYMYYGENFTISNNSSFTLPSGMGLKISSAHEKLFQKGFDITSVQYSNSPFIVSMLLTKSAETSKTILKMDSIKCSDLNIKNSYGIPILYQLMTHPDAKELLPLILEKITILIDLNVKCFNSVDPLISYFENTELFQNYREVILSKSLLIIDHESLGYNSTTDLSDIIVPLINLEINNDNSELV